MGLKGGVKIKKFCIDCTEEPLGEDGAPDFNTVIIDIMLLVAYPWSMDASPLKFALRVLDTTLQSLRSGVKNVVLGCDKSGVGSESINYAKYKERVDRREKAKKARETLEKRQREDGIPTYLEAGFFNPKAPNGLAGNLAWQIFFRDRKERSKLIGFIYSSLMSFIPRLISYQTFIFDGHKTYPLIHTPIIPKDESINNNNNNNVNMDIDNNDEDDIQQVTCNSRLSIVQRKSCRNECQEMDNSAMAWCEYCKELDESSGIEKPILNITEDLDSIIIGLLNMVDNFKMNLFVQLKFSELKCKKIISIRKVYAKIQKEFGVLWEKKDLSESLNQKNAVIMTCGILMWGGTDFVDKIEANVGIEQCIDCYMKNSEKLLGLGLVWLLNEKTDMIDYNEDNFMILEKIIYAHAKKSNFVSENILKAKGRRMTWELNIRKNIHKKNYKVQDILLQDKQGRSVYGIKKKQYSDNEKKDEYAVEDDYDNLSPHYFVE
jgi:hypothetical protein